MDPISAGITLANTTVGLVTPHPPPGGTNLPYWLQPQQGGAPASFGIPTPWLLIGGAALVLILVLK